MLRNKRRRLQGPAKPTLRKAARALLVAHMARSEEVHIQAPLASETDLRSGGLWENMFALAET